MRDADLGCDGVWGAEVEGAEIADGGTEDLLSDEPQSSLILF